MRILNVNQGVLRHSTGLPDAILSTALQVCVERRVFNELNQHMLETARFNTCSRD